MRDLSLHLLDLAENAIRADARTVRLSVAVDVGRDLLTVRVEDDGPGLNVPAEQALDPFYTTKDGKRTGLGLSLFRESAERADGSLTIGRSDLGGALIEGTMRLSHVDCSPLGDLAATVGAIACANPQLDLRVCLSGPGGPDVRLARDDVAAELAARGGATASVPAVAVRFSQRIKAGVQCIWPGLYQSERTTR